MKLLRRVAKFVLPHAVWHRMRLWREMRLKKRVALRFLSEMRDSQSIVSTPMDDLVINALKDLELGTLLEVGSGGGRLANRLAQLGWSVTGVEPDLWFRNVTSTFFENSSEIDCRIIDGDIHSLEFEDGTFDVVVSVAVIEHIENPELAVAELIRCSRDRFVIATPYGHEADSAEHIQHFYDDDIKALFAPYKHETSIVLDRPDGNRTWLISGDGRRPSPQS